MLWRGVRVAAGVSSGVAVAIGAVAKRACINYMIAVVLYVSAWCSYAALVSLSDDRGL